MDVFRLKVECGLDDGTLARNHHHFVIPVPECGTDAPGVTHREHLAAPGQAAHYISTIEMRHRGTQHIFNQYVIINVTGYAGSLEAHALGFYEQSLHFTVQPVSHQFERDIGIAEETWRLPLVGQEMEYLVDVRHVEIAAQA